LRTTNEGNIRIQIVREKSYDFLNRLTSISSSNTTLGTFNSHVYTYNDGNLRTRVNLADGSYWIYQYDKLGQVTSGKKYWNDGTSVAGQQFEYTFDDIGNRTLAREGGDEWGGNLRQAAYGANLLNQYTNRTVAGFVNVTGTATNTATVTVNNQGTYRRGAHFRAEILATNDVAPAWMGITNLAVLTGGTDDIITNRIGHVFVSQTPETFKYDADGNLTNDGRWSYTWDGENRLLTITGNTNLPAQARRKLDFTYDYRGRRITKRVSNWNGTAYVLAYTNKFLYDGWNVIAELDQTNGVVRSFLWGIDLSGTMDGAGGVGGLLAITVATNGTHFPAFDGNGNVSVLISASSGTVTASYDFGPFGEVLRAEGTAAYANPVRFSTKYQDAETDLLYYGERYYSASTGRWLSRDPIEESDGPNVYAFVRNDPIDAVDSDGRFVFKAQGIVQRSIARGLNSFAETTESAFLGGAAAGLASLYQASADMMDPSWSDYLDRTLRRYDNADRIYDRELGRCGEDKLWAGWAAGAYFLGDYFGLNGLPEGIYGVDLITEESLNGIERWSRGLSGLGSSILFATPALSQFSAANGVPSLTGSIERFGQATRGAASALAESGTARFFYDNRRFAAISREYWNGIPANGASLHHWGIPQRAAWVPQGVRNAGWNLVELPALNGLVHPTLSVNTWMGFARNWGGRAAIQARIVENGMRLGIPSLGAGVAVGGYYAGDRLRELLLEE
jgi:RHS repeat-associated protein